MIKKPNKKIVVLLCVIIVVLIMLIMALSMQIQNIDVEGNEQYTDKQIEEYVFKNTYDKNVLVLWLKTKMGKTESIPFVQKYDVDIESMHKVKITVYEKSIVGYIDYMGNCMYFDKDGIVVESSDKKIDNIPRVTGLQFDYILLHEPLPVEDTNVFDVVLTVTQTLKKYNINVSKIYVSKNMEITLYYKKVKIYLGTEEKISEKIGVLRDMYSKIGKYSGTLDISEIDTQQKGYTLKKDKQ